MDEYSTDKLRAHPGVIKSMRDSGAGKLLTVHLMPQNLCNQSCSFCVVEGTVLLDRGPTPIQDVVPGDVVVIGDQRSTVLECHQREESELVKIKIEGGVELFVTQDHPVYTYEQGFVAANALSPGDRVATDMRMRLWGDSDRIRSRTKVAVEPVQVEPSATPHTKRRRTEKVFRKDEEEQPHEGLGGGSESGRKPRPQLLPQVSRGTAANLVGRQEAHGVRQPDERPGGLGDGATKSFEEQESQQEREVLHGDRLENHAEPEVGRGRISVDKSMQPGFSTARGEEGHRGLPGRILQSPESQPKDRHGVWPATSPEVRFGRLVLPRRFYANPTKENSGWTSVDSLVVSGGRQIRGLEARRVLSVEPVREKRVVHNLSCDPIEAFIVNGILTHNCSYRLEGNKNSMDFDEFTSLPWGDMSDLLLDLKDMGVLGIEVTGGGEPLIYPYAKQLWERLHELGFATALVTNGTALGDKAPLITRSAKWVRVSIDAGCAETYAVMRGCNSKHFDLAWHAVREFHLNRPDDPDFRLGVGYVISNENMGELSQFCEMARISGADNVRLSVAYSDLGIDYFHNRQWLEGEISEAAKVESKLSSPTFRVHNLTSRRHWEIQHQHQDYKRCPTKDLLCVVEGEGKVYTCCTFTGSLKGCYGKFTDHPGGFRGLWEDNEIWRRNFDASKYCDVACLYRDRNLAMNGIIDCAVPVEEIQNLTMLHKEFI